MISRDNSLFVHLFVYPLVAILVLLAIAPLQAAEEIEVDYVGYAALMMKEGDYAKAGEALEKVDPTADEVDRKRFYSLRGLVHLNRALHQKAIDDFHAAIEAGQEAAKIHLYMAQGYYGLKAHDRALESLDKANALAEIMPAIWHMRAQIYWDKDEKGAAWNVLSRAEDAFPNQHSFTRRKVFVLIEMGLYKEAARLGRDYLQHTEAGVQDYIAISTALHRSGQPAEALNFLETARLRFPGERKIYLAMAHAYLAIDKTFAAASLLEEGAVFDNSLLKDAAELYRRSGHSERALYLNSRMLDQEEKLKQRLALLLEAGYHDKVIAMNSGLKRTGLMEKQDIQYAMGYAYFKTGDYGKAEKMLQHITDAALFSKMTALRKTMETCLNDSSLCY